ncbi:unnamed protein product [Prunus armeniaca]
MCHRHIGTFRDSQFWDMRSWAPQALLTKYRQFDPSVNRTPEPCGARNAAKACEDCNLDRSGISEACKDCSSSRVGVTEACEDGVDGINRIDISGMGVRLGGENFSSEIFLN